MDRLTPLDVVVFVTYLLASVAIGVSFTREQRSLGAYFLAGRDMGRIILGMTILAALFSGITFLAAPSEAYANGFAFYLVNLGFFIATPITTLLILPFFYQSRFYTAYDILVARRFQGAGLGETLRFAMRQWRVVGVMEAGNTGFASELWGDVETLLARSAAPPSRR